MTHGTRLERMQQNADWLRVSGDLTLLCNRWSARRDLSVYLGRDGGAGSGSVAFFDPATSQIELNSEMAFGVGSNGALVGDLTEPLELAKYPVCGGMAMHEAGHARYSTSDWTQVRKRFDSERAWNVFVHLEETRIEGRMAQMWPRDVSFLRASSRKIVLGEDQSKWQPRFVAQLIYGRAAVKVLTRADAAPIETYLLANGWTTEILSELTRITVEFMGLSDSGADLDRQIELAKELDEIMPRDPDDSEEGDGDGSGVSDALAKAVEEAMNRAERGGMLGAQKEAQAAQAQAEQAQERREREQQRKNEEVSVEIFKNSTSQSSGVASRQIETRSPTSAERAAALMLARDLERAKYRDRAMNEFGSDVPPGRFNGGEAMRMEAARRNGGSVERYQPFRHRRWQETEEPPLSVGIMADVSGSMRSVQKAVGVATWVMSQAVYRIDRASAAQVYFGERVYPGLAKGEHLRDVRTWTGAEGWENFDRAFRALDGELELLHGRGARLLVVVSDGQYGSMTPVDQAAARDKWVAECTRRGVAVVWLQLRGQHSPVEERPGVEVVTVGTDVLDAIGPIGQACVRALEHAGR